MLYELYLEDESKPAYTYKMNAWLEKRLTVLARTTDISTAEIKVYDRNGYICRTWSVWFGKSVMGSRIWEI